MPPWVGRAFDGSLLMKGSAQRSLWYGKIGNHCDSVGSDVSVGSKLRTQFKVNCSIFIRPITVQIAYDVSHWYRFADFDLRMIVTVQMFP